LLAGLDPVQLGELEVVALDGAVDRVQNLLSVDPVRVAALSMTARKLKAVRRIEELSAWNVAIRTRWEVFGNVLRPSLRTNGKDEKGD
jgi:hypothetical protein